MPYDGTENDLKKIIDQIPNLKNKKAIVFDLRGNDGGNSGYGLSIINKVFGEEYAEKSIAKIEKEMYADYRASIDNLAWIKIINTIFNDDKELEEGIQKSIKNSLPYYSETSETIGNLSTSQEKAEKQTSAKIFAIIDNKNVSDALDFLDALKAVNPQATLIGEKTDTDRLYMDCAQMHLPSGYAIFRYPIKVYRNRPRGDAQPYYPDIEFDTTDTKKLQKYIIDIVK